ncbi:MAG: hypothetical protein AAFV53_02540 [Myxococcota bacterium]
MPYAPLRLLLLFDTHGGLCGPLVPILRSQLEHRAFLVDTHPIQAGPIDIAPYAGLIVGIPVIHPRQPILHPRPRAFLDGLPLHGRPIAVFVVGRLWVGDTLQAARDDVVQRGARLVAARAYRTWWMDTHDESIADECMVRIR